MRKDNKLIIVRRILRKRVKDFLNSLAKANAQKGDTTGRAGLEGTRNSVLHVLSLRCPSHTPAEPLGRQAGDITAVQDQVATCRMGRRDHSKMRTAALGLSSEIL